MARTSASHVAWLKASVMGWPLLSGASDDSSSLPHTDVQPAWPKSTACHHLTLAALLPNWTHAHFCQPLGHLLMDDDHNS